MVTRVTYSPSSNEWECLILYNITYREHYPAFWSLLFWRVFLGIDITFEFNWQFSSYKWGQLVLSWDKDKVCSQVLSGILHTPKGLSPSLLPVLGTLGLRGLRPLRVWAPQQHLPEPSCGSGWHLPSQECLPSPLPPLSFNNLGIQCVRKKEIEAAIERKIQLGIDPYNGESLRLA